MLSFINAALKADISLKDKSNGNWSPRYDESLVFPCVAGLPVFWLRYYELPFRPVFDSSHTYACVGPWAHCASLYLA